MTTIATCIVGVLCFAAGYIAGCARCYPLWSRHRIRADYFYHQYVRDVRKHEQEVNDE